MLQFVELDPCFFSNFLDNYEAAVVTEGLEEEDNDGKRIKDDDLNFVLYLNQNNDRELALQLQKEEEENKLRIEIFKPIEKKMDCTCKGNVDDICLLCNIGFDADEDRLAQEAIEAKLIQRREEEAKEKTKLDLEVLYNDMLDRTYLRNQLKEEISYLDQRHCALVLLKAPLFSDLAAELKEMIAKYFRWKRVAFFGEFSNTAVHITPHWKMPKETPHSPAKNYASHLPRLSNSERDHFLYDRSFIFSLPLTHRSRSLLSEGGVDKNGQPVIVRHVIKKLRVLIDPENSPEVCEFYHLRTEPGEDVNCTPPRQHEGWKLLRTFRPSQWQKDDWQEVSIPAASSPGDWWKLEFYGSLPSMEIKQIRIEGIATL